VRSPRPPWDFPYEPARKPRPRQEGSALDVVVATSVDVGSDALTDALRDLGPVVVEPLIARAPLYWSRVRSSSRAAPDDIAARLGKLPVRYVVSAQTETMLAAPPLVLSRAQRVRRSPAAASSWPTHKGTRPHRESNADGRWFLGEGGGISLDRRVCGTGAGTRLAVVDDEAADAELLEIDRIRCVGVERAPTTTGHAALMISWATGAMTRGGPRFVGVAPDASVRLYCIPKAGVDLVSLPLAIAEAVFDGADVIVCATYAEGTVSPLLDDALDVATHLGRGGRGAAVVFPTGRETSSPGDSIHASLSLGLGDPASDPRIHCIAPGGRGGGWFLWRSPRGKVRPFANRGPAVRWMTPGDDISYPFSSRDRLFHSESSGASAIAAGVMLLVLGCNRGLYLHDLHAILARTVDIPLSDTPMDLVDTADILPATDDRDGHNAKSGYGRLNATRACACATDPIALELSAMGHDDLASSWCTRRRPYSERLGRWVVRALLARANLGHSLRAILRHMRLIAQKPSRDAAHAPGALTRQITILVRELSRMHPPARIQAELVRTMDLLGHLVSEEAHAALEKAAHTVFRDLQRMGTASSDDSVLTASIRA
jgi:hypothetical protein